jgi:hypothetical protein
MCLHVHRRKQLLLVLLASFCWCCQSQSSLLCHVPVPRRRHGHRARRFFFFFFLGAHVHVLVHTRLTPHGHTLAQYNRTLWRCAVKGTAGSACGLRTTRWRAAVSSPILRCYPISPLRTYINYHGPHPTLHHGPRASRAVSRPLSVRPERDAAFVSHPSSTQASFEGTWFGLTFRCTAEMIVASTHLTRNSQPTTLD